MFDVGIDVGSVSVNCIIIDDKGSIVKEYPYLRHFGHLLENVKKTIQRVYQEFSEGEVRSLSLTGNHGEIISERLGLPYEFDSITQVLGSCRLVPGVRTIISMGGQDAALFQIIHHDGGWELESFNMNGPCAAGTGSFIDQQAERLSSSIYGKEIDLSPKHIEETLQDFIRLGMKSKNPASVACRCTVFTKTDMIHLQNKGESLENIIAGLHYGNASNYISTIVSNRKLEAPIIFIGGVASNALQVRAFQHYYPDLIVPHHHTSVGALGVALHAQESGWTTRADIESINEKGRRKEFPRAPVLRLKKTKFIPSKDLTPVKKGYNPPIDVYLGIDIGSTTTKYALMDEHGKIIHKQYVQTQGKPIEVTQRLLRTLDKEIDGWVNFRGVATTGSGRNVVGDFVNADLILDEITAHARGAVEIDPRIDTVFEIGGQDSKYIHIENTHPLDFDMNKVCAAGTGSFLHELANKLKINIVDEFQEIALSSQNPIGLAERCTVFMESDLVSYAQKGAKTNDLIGGLCYAIVHNYLNRVVGRRKIGQRIMFLGGPSLNKGIVAAFENVLDRQLIVPPNREVLGAFGAALAVREKQRIAGAIQSKSHSIKTLVDMEVTYTEKICHADPRCHNECKLKVYGFGKRKSVWGGDCGRYEMARSSSVQARDLFHERQLIFEEYLCDKAEQLSDLKDKSTNRPAPNTVGIPMALFASEWAVLWTHFFAALGFNVKLSPKTNNRLARSGVESMTAETCFPVKVFHGHVKFLIPHVQYLFLPNMINMPTYTSKETGFFCPLVQSSQYIVKAALGLNEQNLLRPTVYLKDDFPTLVRRMYDYMFPVFGFRKSHVEKALEIGWEAQQEFQKRVKMLGTEFLESEDGSEPIWIISGRPYNLYDERLNLRIGRHLSKLGIKAIPQDLLELKEINLSDFPRMYWGFGTRILRAARLIRNVPHFFGVHLTNFSCGADSFLEHFYRYVMGEKPFLILELDEHSAIAGMMTRIEAFQNVVRNIHFKEAKKSLREAS